jgi:hypothetical protein
MARRPAVARRVLNVLFGPKGDRARRNTLRNKIPLVLSLALALGGAACSKTPDAPGAPTRPAPKTTLVTPAPPPPEAVGAIRIPATPAGGPGTLPGRPLRIWI